MFNDTSGLTGLIQECEFLTGLGDANISGNTALMKHFTRNINSRYHIVADMILQAEDGWDYSDYNQSDSAEATLVKNLTANTGYVKLALSDKVLKIRGLEITYDGTNWYKGTPMNIASSGKPFDSTSIGQRFTKSAPFYYQNGLYVYLYPTPDASVTSGVKIWIAKEITEYTTASTTVEPGFDEPFHKMLAIGASLDWASAKGKENKNDLAAMWADYEGRLKRSYGKKNMDEPLVLKPAYNYLDMK